jgi:hypothetical protein
VISASNASAIRIFFTEIHLPSQDLLSSYLEKSIPCAEEKSGFFKRPTGSTPQKSYTHHTIPSQRRVKSKPRSSYSKRDERKVAESFCRIPSQNRGGLMTS